MHGTCKQYLKAHLHLLNKSPEAIHLKRPLTQILFTLKIILKMNALVIREI